MGGPNSVGPGGHQLVNFNSSIHGMQGLQMQQQQGGDPNFQGGPNGPGGPQTSLHGGAPSKVPMTHGMMGGPPRGSSPAGPFPSMMQPGPNGPGGMMGLPRMMGGVGGPPSSGPFNGAN